MNPLVKALEDIRDETHGWKDGIGSYVNRIATNALSLYSQSMNTEDHARDYYMNDSQSKPGRFKKPTDEQIVKAAIVFNNGKMDKKQLINMVALCDFVIDRLYENGDILIPSSKEQE